MSEKYPTDHERRQINQACPTCRAEPLEWCTTKHGSRATFLHSRRPPFPPPSVPREADR